MHELYTISYLILRYWIILMFLINLNMMYIDSHYYPYYKPVDEITYEVDGPVLAFRFAPSVSTCIVFVDIFVIS